MRNDLKAKQTTCIRSSAQQVAREENEVIGVTWADLFFSSENESCSIVLYLLEFRKKMLRTARPK